MKIQNINNMEIAPRSTVGIEQHETDGARPLVFSKALTELSAEHFQQRISALLGDIDAQAAKLSKRADLKEFERYRSLIREFMDEIVSNGYEFNREDNYAARGKHRVFATVNKVNEELDAMAREMLSGHTYSIEMLNQIDDIRGLLLDMLL